MLFAELYPDTFIKKMINMFDVKVKEVKAAVESKADDTLAERLAVA
jgi:FKBP-type peptidyl-prolyl cis-trans isomerase (trigger factor)